MRTAATTEPGRLQIIGAALAVLVIAFGAVTAFEIAGRSAAADDVVSRSQPLSAEAANIYRSLADADTAAAGGFLAGAQEPRDVHERYEKDIKDASRLLVKAASTTDASSPSGQEITKLNEELPRYTGLIERARANNRQGLPLGGAYLRYANQKMSTELLPAAERLYTAETGRLDQDYDSARAWPFLSLGLGVVALGALFWAQRRNYRRTNRVFNHGLLAATAASTVLLLWLGVGHTVARSELQDANVHGQQSLDVLNHARINSLKARANENLTLVARGAVLTADGKNDKYQTDYTTGMKALREELGTARKLADDSQGSGPVADAISGVSEWQGRHRTARTTDDNGDYEGALKQIIGPRNSTGESFNRVDEALEKALAHEQGEFTRAAEDGRGALGGLPIGAAALAVLAAVAAIVGVNRRLSEYR
ncbi:hypothetical protein OIE70_28640 [Streptomyces sp. NBC_01744]|nr:MULTISPECIES: hypothetical protein [unclassified Streptomyces]WSF90105.1 hypothetical protein OIE70_28640 [Streptomyces sp. NBC_01744]WSC42164.1 hypothetical protein OHA08_16635 [Streptomyces sp. NBC_01763]WSC50493.1 hypothetical protein OIE61_14875 [Streptomyces sp. NBC_01762]WSC58981.1 hypothetical protein OG808_28480 [Streptomyces sp. NBC_01761]WSD30098.1 hypothetical protein OHA26_15610 [Streptomyces sp. NBC_01751]